MEILLLLLGLAVWGVVFGALGRLVVPGPNAMGMGATILAGIAGAFLGTLGGSLIGLDPGPDRLLFFVLQVLGAAVIVLALTGRRRRVSY
jgi:uncharacterized membrane protein YeaQ/YmgE (transglycosylase-associated protein family)